MRWLTVGPYPPSTDPAARATRAVVEARLATGDDVRVVSPEPSAAHEVDSFAGPLGLARLFRRARSFDGLWIRIGDGIGPTAHAGRGRALVERAVLGAALRGPEQAVVDVADLAAFPGGRAGRFVFDSGATFIVSDSDQRDALIARGAASARVMVRTSEPSPSAPAPTGDVAPDAVVVERTPPPPEPVPADVDPATLERWIRTRASAVSGSTPPTA